MRAKRELVDLPDELLIAVLHYALVDDLVALSLTSKKLRRLAHAPRLWYDLLDTQARFDTRRDYIEEYAWRFGHLTVDVRSDLIPKDDELFKILTFFPLHRSYHGRELAAACSPEYLPWAKYLLSSSDRDLLLLAVRPDSIVAHSYHPSHNEGRHTLEIFRRGHETIQVPGLPDWPLCATFLGPHHVVVCGRFPAILVYDLRREEPIPSSTLALSSHTINCMTVDDPDVGSQFIVAGHYKGRGSMELIEYHFDSDLNLDLRVVERNRFGSITAIVSCVYLPIGFVTYDNYGHVYLWRDIHSTMRKIDHDGIKNVMPGDMVYKMFYSDRQLIFIDQYKRQTGFVIRLGKDKRGALDSNVPAESLGPRPGAEAATGSEEQQVQDLLLNQTNAMAALARRILGL